MEVDDESHCHRIIDYKENIREAQYLKCKHLYRKGRIQDNREGKIGYNKWENDWNYWKARLSIKDNQIKLVQQLRLGSKRAKDFKSINGSVKISIKVSDDGRDSHVDNSVVKIPIEAQKNTDNINLDGKRTIYLSRVNLDGSWSIKGSNNDSNNERKYKKKDDDYKIIEVDKDINKSKRLRLDGNTKLKIKDDKIYLEYEVDDKIYREYEVNAEEGNSNDLKIEDKTFEDAMTTHYWYAILKKKENHDKFFLQYEVPSDKDVMQLSVEGNKLINLKYYENNEDNEDTKRSTNNEDNKRSTNNEDNKRSTNIEDIIKLTYDKMVYEEDLTKNFKSLTINNERTDEMTISNDYGTIEFRQHSILRRCQHDKYTIEQDDETIIIRIQVYAHSIVKITNKKDDDTKEKDDPMVTRLDHGGELKIQINRNTNDQNIGKNGVKIVLSRNINLHNGGLLKIKNGCVTFVEMPENKRFIDLTKHGFLNFVVYHHKKRVEKLRNLKKKLLHNDKRLMSE
ncbi:8917_t:CDS:2 [Racocetra fulgida]|uniref:8917_t:CDS:1 n=1 Tax=Racocetra fulgida TaxID=60492 RepID=A0A9N9C8B1_9GLOM|nr:8917_t:CDS:2 [Racocetra fulgida]